MEIENKEVKDKKPKKVKIDVNAELKAEIEKLKADKLKASQNTNTELIAARDKLKAEVERLQLEKEIKELKTDLGDGKEITPKNPIKENEEKWVPYTMKKYQHLDKKEESKS